MILAVDIGNTNITIGCIENGVTRFKARVATDALKTCAEVGGMENSETELITGGEEAYTLRFKSFEWLQQLIDWLS